MPPLVKICGLSEPASLAAAIEAGADWIGLVFFPKSPRHVGLTEARALAEQARRAVKIVALTVDPDDATLGAILDAVAPDMVQLHGSESPDRVAFLRQRFGVPVMKAVGVAGPGDLAVAGPYRSVADFILFDAKPPRGAVLPGGNGAAFDWGLLRNATGLFVLSGGLSPDNVAEAVQVTAAYAVDVSSGVESAPGVKDPTRIRAFVAAAKGRALA